MTAINPATLVAKLEPINSALDDALDLLTSASDRIRPYRIEMHDATASAPRVPLMHPADQSAALDDAVEASHLLTVASAKIEGAIGSGSWMQDAVDTQRQWTDHAATLLRKPTSEVSADEVSAALTETWYGFSQARNSLHGLEEAANALTQSGSPLPWARGKDFSAERAADIASTYGTRSDYVAAHGGIEIASEPFGMTAAERNVRR